VQGANLGHEVLARSASPCRRVWRAAICHDTDALSSDDLSSNWLRHEHLRQDSRRSALTADERGDFQRCASTAPGAAGSEPRPPKILTTLAIAPKGMVQHARTSRHVHGAIASRTLAGCRRACVRRARMDVRVAWRRRLLGATSRRWRRPRVSGARDARVGAQLLRRVPGAARAAAHVLSSACVETERLQLSRSRMARSICALSLGLRSGPPAIWPHADSMTRSSALGMCAASHRLSSG
jgi:hypothetical protein